jgi:hypothetical protein
VPSTGNAFRDIRANNERTNLQDLCPRASGVAHPTMFVRAAAVLASRNDVDLHRPLLGQGRLIGGDVRTCLRTWTRQRTVLEAEGSVAKA